MTFYKRHIGDYAADTRHLSVLEHGAYGILLDRYYATERSLPLDILKFIAPRNKEEVAAFKSVLRQFFKRTHYGYSHSRCANEIRNYKSKIETYRLSGRKGGIKRQAIAKQSLGENRNFRLTEEEVEGEAENSKSKAAGKPSGAPSLRTESEQRRIVEAKNTRISKESELYTELRIGAGPIVPSGARLKPEVLERIRARDKAAN